MFDEPVVGREGRFSRAVAELERQILADANKLMLTVIWGLVDVSADLELKVSELQDRIKKSIPENLKELLGEIEVIGVDPEGQLVLRFSVSDSRVNQWYLLNPDLFIEEAYVDPSTTPSSQHAVTVSTISKPHVPEAKRHETVSSPVNIVFKEESTAPYGFNIYFQFENPQVKHELLVNLDNRFNAPVSKKINRESFKEQDAIQKAKLGSRRGRSAEAPADYHAESGSAAGVRERFTFLKELVINEVRKGYADWQVPLAPEERPDILEITVDKTNEVVQVAYKLPRRLPSEDTHVCILRLMPVTNNLSSFELREIEKFGPVPIGEFQSLKSEISE